MTAHFIATIRTNAPTLWLIGIALAFCSTLQAASMEDVEIATTDLGSGIYMLTGRGGNIGISTGKDGVFMIDDQFAPLASKITDAVAKLSDLPVKIVLNTHWHGDHTGGNELFGSKDALIFAHANVRKRMSTDQFIAAFKRKVPAAPDGAWPVVTFTRDVNLHLNGNTIEVIHIPNAHTDGDAIVIFGEANVVHMGDIFFAGMYPFIDLSSGGSIDGMMAAVRSGLARSNAKTKIIPGHGPLQDKAGLEAYLVMLETIRNKVAKLKAKGRTLEETQAAKPGGAYNAEIGDGFIKPDVFVEFVFQSL